MAENPQTAPYPIAADDRAMPVMVYLNHGIARGEMVIKQTIRISTWFRSASPADFLNLHKVQMLIFAGAGLQSYSYPEIFLPASTIIGAHLLPPAEEPLDYDLSEPNRKMESVAIQFSTFRGTASLRMAAATSLGVFLASTREAFVSLYDAEISNPLIPNMGTLRAPILLIRPGVVTFASRSAG